MIGAFDPERWWKIFLEKTELIWYLDIIREEGKWSSEGAASFGFSFVLVVLAAGIYLLDIAIIYIATRDPYRNKKAKLLNALPGKQAGDTMLY